ncbi:MAG: hypothetical protein N2595_10845 [bacterium]|nr:hypothetical protein [bacterium]
MKNSSPITNSLPLSLSLFALLPSLTLAHPPAGPFHNVGPPPHPTGTNVLVLYNAAWPDQNANGTNDSAEVAFYYAHRRAIPTNNLLALLITNFMGTYGPPHGPSRSSGEPRMLLSTNVTLRYDSFYSNIVVPLAHYLLTTNPLTAQPYRDSILFLCPVYGVPYYVDTCFTDLYEYPVYSLRSTIHNAPEFTARLRSLDLFLCNVFRRYYGGIVWTNGLPKPGRPPSSPYGYPPFWGDDQVEIGAPTNTLTETPVPLYFDYASNPASAYHFADLRASDPSFNYDSFGFFLVTRLDAPTPELAKALVDKAIYAEHYLYNWAGSPHHPFYTRFYCGDDPDYAGALFTDFFPHNRGVDIKNWVLGVNRGAVNNSVFSPSLSNALPPWDVIYDNHPREIGELQHTPRIQFTIASLTSNSVSLSYLNNSTYAWWMLPPLESAATFSNLSSAVSLTLLGSNSLPGTYFVSSTNACAPGDLIEFAHPCLLPITDAFFYSEYYTIDGAYNYRDCWLWPPGAIAFYNQSWSAYDFRRFSLDQFAGPAIIRGLSATAGPLAEPLSIGIPLVPRFLRALSQGFCFAEACYNSLFLAECWMTVCIGDPLYNPFLPLWLNSHSNTNGDHSPPALLATNDFHSFTIFAWLDNSTPDNSADIAQFQLFAGYDSNAWTFTNLFYSWPHPSTSVWIHARNYNWTRSASWPYPPPASSFFYQVSARDPYGNLTTLPPQPVVIPEALSPFLLCTLSFLLFHPPRAPQLH